MKQNAATRLTTLLYYDETLAYRIMLAVCLYIIGLLGKIYTQADQIFSEKVFECRSFNPIEKPGANKRENSGYADNIQQIPSGNCYYIDLVHHHGSYYRPSSDRL